MTLNNRELFIQLVRLGIGHEACLQHKKNDWVQLKAFADEQGLTAIVLDGIDSLPVDHRPPQALLLELIGEVLQNYEQRYKQCEQAIGSLADFYNSHGFKMMVLKGHACSLDWPKPEHRPCGDIDIWLFGQQKDADATISSVERVEVDTSEHHHTVFYWQNFMVENHYDFINVHHHKSHGEYERILKYLGRDDSHYTEVNGERVYLPSPNLHALFLFKHLMLHFATGEITFRQVMDWAFFVEKHGSEVDWPFVTSVLEKHGMMRMFNVVNAICVEDLGFKSAVFPQVQFDSWLKDRVMDDIFNPKFAGIMPQNLFARVVYKFKRWKANEWKHELCYEESMWSAFWSGVWGHLLKPSSI